MDAAELREPDATRAFLCQSLWLSRVVPPAPGMVRQALEWTLELAASGQSALPVGIVADLGHTLVGYERHAALSKVEPPGVPSTLLRSYDDYVLGKFATDWTVERAADALRHYTAKDQSRGIAFVVRQLRERGGFGGVELYPAAVRNLLTQPPEELLNAGYEMLSREGPMPLIVSQYEAVVRAVRRMAEALSPEDVTAIEQKTALAELGQFVAHRQILLAAARIDGLLPARPVKPAVGRKEVPTRVLDEDHYPVGGYTSIATKGSVESLLHSQLAYMEDEQPDLFDMKFVRDELFYYSRDENQFLRRRRVFVFALQADLASARFKDASASYQRIVFVLAMVLSCVRKLSDWLSTDALKFELVFLGDAAGKTPLQHEWELMQLLLKEWTERGSAELRLDPTPGKLRERFETEARTSQVQVLVVGESVAPVESEVASVATLEVSGPTPSLRDGHGRAVELGGDVDAWAAAAAGLLAQWI